MIDDAALIEIFIRSMNAGASLLVALVLVSKRPVSWRHALAALFSISVASYVVASSPILLDIFGAWFAPFYLLSICAGVIFWWFSLALFDDGFRWRWRHLIPLVMTAPLVFAHFMLAERAGPIWVGALGLARIALIFWANAPSEAISLADRAHLAHELVHVWQYRALGRTGPGLLASRIYR